MPAGEYSKKVLVLVGVGIVALMFVLATLFTSLTETDTRLSSTIPLPLGSPDFITAVESITGSTRRPVDSDIEAFNNGDSFLADLLAEIGAAQRSVTITNYIFRAGRMADATLDALAERASAGIEVRLLLDGNGANKAPDDKVEALRRAGGRVETFRPFGFRSLARVHKRTHVRAIVIDGTTGYTGGVAFDDGWLGDGVGEEEWRDVMFKYRGALARASQDHFNALWRQTDGEILSGPGFFPRGGAASSHRRPATDTTTAATDTVASSGASWFVSLFHSPVPDLSTDLQDLIWLSIVGAQDHVYIATPYMTPDHDIRDAILAAPGRGVRVEVLLPGPYTDAKLIQAATRAYYDELLGAGVRIFEYQVGRMHQKTLTADGHWSLIGSANMDNRSATLNVENVFGVEGAALATALEEELRLGKSMAREITVANWHPNPIGTLNSNLARIFAKQY